MLSLRQLKYFTAAAELRRVSEAAMHLSISQSAVTTAIREIEKHTQVMTTTLSTSDQCNRP